VDSAVREVPRNIDALLANANWASLMGAARETGARFDLGAI
jgi:hypothetical protein